METCKGMEAEQEDINTGMRNGAIQLVACATEAEAHAVKKVCFDGSYSVICSMVPADVSNAMGTSARILLVGSGKAADTAHALSKCDSFSIDLLIAHDERVLEREDLLKRCANVLFAPYDDETLLRHVSELFANRDIEPEIYANIIGRSPQIRRMRRVMQTIAAYDAPVLIKGETGTGKELVARGIHYTSARRDMPFVPVNCGALSDDLLLAELFGYEKGAFTDAKRSHRGLVAQAKGGVLFLDEVDCLSPKGQAALLRFLQEQEYRPLGSETPQRADVRVITATNKDIDALVAQQRFREDLYYRIHLLDVHLPPLRGRSGDITVLAEHVLNQLSKRHGTPPKRLHALTLRWMNEYAWPGNVRELENYLFRIFVLSKNPVICVPRVKGDPVTVMDSAPAIKDESANPALPFRDEKMRALRVFEKSYLQRVMQAAGGNISLAARRAGKERQAFRRLLKKHGIARETYKTFASLEE